MAVMITRRIVIDLMNKPYIPMQRETIDPVHIALHFVNLGSANDPEFELRQGQQPAYRLLPEENAKLLRLMQGMTISAPQTPVQALDGMVTELSIRQHGSELLFRWHIQLPTEWDSIGKLVAFATSFQE